MIMVKKTMNFYAPKDLLDKTKTLATEELVSISNICTKALSYYVKNYADIRHQDLKFRQNSQ